jgi:hypothetical protein
MEPGSWRTSSGRTDIEKIESKDLGERQREKRVWLASGEATGPLRLKILKRQERHAMCSTSFWHDAGAVYIAHTHTRMRANRRRKKTDGKQRASSIRIRPPKIERNHAVRHYGGETSRSGIRAVETSDVTLANGSLINFSLNKRYSMAAYKFVKRHYYY